MSENTLFQPVDYKTLIPLSNTWKKAVSVAVEAAFGSGCLIDTASKVGLGTRALYDIADYHSDKNIVVSDAEWQMAAVVLGKMLVVLNPPLSPEGGRQ